MKKEELVEGRVYKTNQGVHVRLDKIERHEGFRMANYVRPAYTRYLCTKLSTGRQITIKSAQKFRREIGTPVVA